MKEKEMASIGSVSSIAVGILYLTVAVTHMLIPVEQRAAMGDGHGFYQSFSQDPTFSLLEWWQLALISLLGIAVVLAVQERFAGLHAGWVRWASGLALLGFGANAIIEFTSVARHPVLAAGYMAGDASTRAAIAAQPALVLDPYGWLRFGVIGFWVLVISLLALRAGAIPRLLGYVGVGAALAFFILVAGFMQGQEMLIMVGAGLGGVIFAPAWFVWLGLLLRREEATVPATRLAASPG